MAPLNPNHQQAVEDAKREAEARNDTVRSTATRSVALELAVRSLSGMQYDDKGNKTTDFNEVVKAADAYNTFLKG